MFSYIWETTLIFPCGASIGAETSLKSLIGCKRKSRETKGEGHTVHLALIGENDLASATGRIDRQRLLKALLDIRTPHALRIVLQRLIQSLAQLLASAPRRGRRDPLGRQDGGGKAKRLSGY